MRYVIGFIFVLALGVMGCSETSGPPPDDSPYASKDLWLCRPDIEDDHCDTADLSTTEIQPDGSMVTLAEVAPNPDAEVDCFYVYPTVNYDLEPGNTEVLFPHPEEVVQIVSWQASHYRGVCRLFAPLYRQTSQITYTAHAGEGIWETTDFFKLAYGDVVDAFEYYLRNHNDGRDIVFIGHSQGSHMLRSLMADKIDDDPALRGQLLLALLMGATGRVQVLEGDVVGGSFENIPLCTSNDQTECVIVFDANAAGVDTVYDGITNYSPPNARPCVNPASIEGGAGTLGAYLFPRSSWNLGPRFPEGVDTEWVRYPNIYTSRCADADEQHVLLVDLAPDYTGPVPMTPEDIQDIYVENGSFLSRNLHGVESYITSTDLVRIVEQRIASRGN
jgi:hypothetical protein